MALKDHSPQDMHDLAALFQRIADGLEGYADKMEEADMPAFRMMSKKYESMGETCEAWMLGLAGAWTKQFRAFEAGRRVGNQLRAEQPTTPPKKRGAKK